MNLRSVILPAGGRELDFAEISDKSRRKEIRVRSEGKEGTKERTKDTKEGREAGLD